MLFFTWTFAIFFIVFYPLFLLVRKHTLARNLLLIAAAYVFYGWWDVRFLGLLAFTTALDYLTALGAAGRFVTFTQVGRSCLFLSGTALIAVFANGFRQLELMTLPILAALALFCVSTALLNSIEDMEKRRSWWLALCVVVNLSVLAFFKYFNFFGDTLDAALSEVGIDIGFVSLAIILPLGISFHTFQSIGRTIDVRRDRLEPSTNFVEFATFLTFFPQILAGPIERAQHMLPQFQTVRALDFGMVKEGMLLFLWGMFKKVVIADNMAQIANPVFADPSGLTSGELLIGALAFTFQIYGDFSGYTDMARGLAKMMGFELMFNFRLPYFSRTPSEFWQRWHISLSSWLRDYLYIGLGGNREGVGKTYRNLLATMVLGGLWHGAAWTFVMWGFLHGMILVIYRAVRVDQWLFQQNRNGATLFANFAAWALLMPQIIVTWIYFRATGMDEAGQMITGILQFDQMAQGNWAGLAFYVLPFFLVETAMRICGDRIALANLPFFVRYTAVLTLILSILTLQSGAGQDFIYFDF